MIMKKHTPCKFLIFDQFHQTSVLGIAPAAIKKSAQETLKVRDRERIKLETAQNHICNTLGFKGGFAGYQQEFKEKLIPFLQDNGLDKYCDLINHKTDDRFVSLSYQQVADAFFLTKKECPQRLFTGQGVSIFDLFVVAYSRQDCEVIYSGKPVSEDRYKDYLPGGLGVAAKGIKLVYTDLHGYNNMLGEQLLQYADKEKAVTLVAENYWQNGTEGTKLQQERLQKAGELLRALLSELDDGWVDVIPYNDKLIFLKGKNGRYDFIFKGMRNKAFEHNLYEPYLKNADIPTTAKDYDFQRWLYFPANNDNDDRKPYAGWEAFDRHHAEIAFYEKGGILSDYPRADEILRQYLTDKGIYQPLAEQAELSDGFYSVAINDTNYAVSNLITIAEFKNFISSNPDYEAYRNATNADDWRTVNQDDGTLPAAVTWYDAMAYTAWISKNKKLPVRLLEEAEYCHIASCLSPEKDEAILSENWKNAPRLNMFFSADGTAIENHPPYMPEAEFQKLILKYNKDALIWKEQYGLFFLHSRYFAEWLRPEAAAMSCFFLGSIYSTPDFITSAARERFAASSMGKGKSMKIGFRMIYQLK